MRQSQLFTKVLREAPSDAVSANAKLLERAGFVHKNSAGVYSYLPLGFRVMRKIADIVRQEMDAIGGQEILLPALIDRRYLDATGRGDVAIGYEVRGKGDSAAQYVLGWTHEEVLTDIVSRYVSSYRDVPFSAYQIQTKFRNEARAKSGVLRGREFIMKDMYSFHASFADFESFYAIVREAYLRVFSRCGLNAIYTVAGGGAFTANVTHEFQVVTPVGEDVIFVCAKCGYAENAEISKYTEGGACAQCAGIIEKKTAVEVGNIFPLGTKYSDAFNVCYMDEKGARQKVVMGSYGIGISRCMGVIAEIHHTDAGCAWPVSVAPFAVHLLDLTKSGTACADIYAYLCAAGVEVLWDDREVSSGDKFTVADVIGLPYRAVVGENHPNMVEFRKQGETEARILSPKEFLAELIHGI